MREERIELSKLRFSDNRTYGGEGDIKILAEDMKLNDIINPITVKVDEEGIADYVVVAGRRRVSAARLLGWTRIPSRVLEGDETERADEIAGAENINRLGMHPLDEAVIFKKLLDNGDTIEALATRFDRKVSAIWQRVQLLGLDENIKTMFRDGHITLLSAAMLKNLNEDAQKAFHKKFKGHWGMKEGAVIEDRYVSTFISNLDHDRLYGFLKDNKQCSECKTRTFYTDKNLFPELNDKDENCFNHACYMEKWDKVLAGRIKSLRAKHKTHSETVLISSNSDRFQKITGNKITIDGVEFKVLPFSYYTHAQPDDKGAQPCFLVGISNSGKLEIAPEYWKEPEKETAYDFNGPSEKKRKNLTPIVKLLELPKEEQDEALDAMNNSKRISQSGISDNVRDSVFWRIMEIKAKDFNDPSKIDSIGKELFLKKHFHYLHGNGKRIFEMFVGDMEAPDIAKLVSDKVFMLLAAMELNEYELSDPVKFEKGEPCELLKWADIPNDVLKQLYQEEIRKRIPKKKPEPKKAKKPVDKKSAKAKPETKKPAGKKPAKGKAKE